MASSSTPKPSRIAFLFPGQGAQHVGVARELYDRSPGYAEAFDSCLDLFEAAGLPLRRWWQQGDEARLRSPEAALPLTFAVEHALTRAWQSWGITPSAVLGLSIGEMTAGTVAGIFSLEDAVQAVVIRAQALQALPPGGLLAVFASQAEVEPVLPDGVWTAVISGPGQLVVAGPLGALADAAAALERAGLACRPVPTTHAAHSPIAAPAVPVFDKALRGLHLAAPTIDFYSANTGRLAGPDESTDPGFWSRQLAQPVLFGNALDVLTAAPGRLLMIEVGPGQMLTKVVRTHPTVVTGRHRALATLAFRPAEPLAQPRAALAAIVEVSAAGHPVDWPALEALVEVDRASVPGYPFDRGFPPVGAPAAAEAETEQVADADEPPPTADRLRQLWSAVLGEDDISQDADFFDLGGNSLSAVKLISNVRAEFGIELSVVTLFEHSTLDALAGQIDRRIG
jgi:acyl transferase domain-containing protein